MDKIHKYVSDLTSFDEGQSYFSRMKEHSSRRFKEITKMLREEGKKRREKKEQNEKNRQSISVDNHFNTIKLF